MKRLSLLTFTMIMSLGCQRSHANEGEITLPTAADTEAAPSSTGAPRLTSCYEADEWICAVEAAIVEKTNQKRTGLNKLNQSFETSYAARVHSIDMSGENGVFSHDGFSDEREETLRNEFPGLSIDFFGENIGWTSQYIADPEVVAEEFVRMWWNSKGHKDNILGKGYRYIGVGIARSDRGIFATQIFH